MTTQHVAVSRWGSSSFESLIGSIAILCSAGAAAIHFAVLGEHFDESWLYGAFFAVVAWFQVVWALAVLREASPGLYWAGAAVNAAIIAIWAVTRTLGVPIGPASGEVEAVGVADVFATLFEVVIVLTGAFLALRVAKQDGEPPFPGFWFAVGVAAVVVAAATSFSLVDLAGGEEAAGGHGETAEDAASSGTHTANGGPMNMAMDTLGTTEWEGMNVSVAVAAPMTHTVFQGDGVQNAPGQRPSYGGAGRSTDERADSLCHRLDNNQRRLRQHRFRRTHVANAFAEYGYALRH